MGGVWGGVSTPLPSRLGGLREGHELPRRDRGGDPAGNAFWHILKATERSSFAPVGLC